MILGCHLEADAETFRQDEIDRGLKGITEVAYAIGVDQAFKRSDPAANYSDQVIRTAFMTPWFLMDYVLHPEKSVNQPRHAGEMAKIDLSPLRAASDQLKALSREIRAERDRRRRLDRPDLDDLHIDGPAPDLFAESIVRHADGRLRPVFHVSGQQFDSFLPFSHFGTAAAVSRHAHNMTRSFPLDGVVVYGAWLDVRNPLVLEDAGTASSIWMIRTAHETGVLTLDEMKWIAGHERPQALGEDAMIEAEGNSPRVMLERFAAVLKGKGHDSVRYENDIEGGGTSWAILSPEQVDIAWTKTFGFDGDRFYPIGDPAPSFGV